MEWIVTTGKTVAEAVEAALDELGVDEADIEYEVLEESKRGFLSRLGGGSPARIKARVKPLSREKPDRRRRSGGGQRDRDRRTGSGDGSRSERSSGERSADRPGGERSGGGGRSGRSRPAGDRPPSGGKSDRPAVDPEGDESGTGPSEEQVARAAAAAGAAA